MLFPDRCHGASKVLWFMILSCFYVVQGRRTKVVLKICRLLVAHAVILAIQEAEIRRMEVRSQPKPNSSEQIVPRPYLEKTFTKIGLVEWFEVKTLSSKPQYLRKKN
jgi:hypothetical protein